MSKTNPSHYKHGKIEVIQLTSQLDFCSGNVVKYLARAGLKAGESRLEDLRKAKWYLDYLLAEVEALEGSLTAPEANAGDQSDSSPEAVTGDPVAFGVILKECHKTGEPVRDCKLCLMKKLCPLAESGPADDIADYHTSVPESITRAGVRRKIL